MTGVVEKFFITSMVMWMAPLAILYSFYYGYIPGASQLSAENKTLISGFIAVISVNLVIGFYICMAMKESPSSTNPQPDPKFLAEAKASINQSENAASSSTGIDQTSGKDSDQNKGKME
ncbi:vacuolar ATPase assembly integral membrane protein VMA21-like domain-containing protein [Carex rostrata]